VSASAPIDHGFVSRALVEALEEGDGRRAVADTDEHQEDADDQRARRRERQRQGAKWFGSMRFLSAR